MKFCLKGQDANAKQVCFTGKDGRIESGQPVVAAVVIEPEAEPKKILRVTLPLGMQLAPGTRLSIDNNPPSQSPYVICFQNGCMSDYEATPELIAKLKAGQNLSVEAFNGNGGGLMFPLPLAEFPKAFDGPPMDPKEFEATQTKLQADLEKRAAAAKVANRPANDVPVAAAPAAPSPGRRVALVLGNSAYRFMPVLQNPRNDAVDVERALKGLGFETVLATDLDRVAMNAAVSRFSRIVQGADVAIVYYSGHGMQFSGKNYLLPTDANLETAADVNRFQLMPVDDLIDMLGSAKGLQLIVLDACRNNPVERDFKNKVASASPGNRDASSTRGFSRIDARSGLVITYATAPNDVAADGNGRNSPFTQAFLKNVVTPDLDIRQMLFRVQSDVYTASGSRQLPEISSLYVGPDVRLLSSVK
jgi:invasion protein IalB